MILLLQSTYLIHDKVGIRFGTAGLIAKLAKEFPDTAITVTVNGASVKATQPRRLLTAGARQGDTLAVAADGPDEAVVIATLSQLFQSRL